ncbi:hypothetical protein SAMN05443144_113111 [Fodinibius roseus]|uniref:NIPSNAP protein n=1 Tax=Fodinibius roseus TaxID=1194090 RepID=A0A1M5ENJ8_9BACT|nr:hypothetical protein [Fodinibius roseus]SHF80671.1 hypothetical protein SAMN05443144_113111 [Fodinibius roseus]
MKKFTFFPVLLILIVTGTVFAQPAPNEYKKMDYIHVGPDQFFTFTDQVTHELRAVYQQLVEDDALKNWQLYHVSYPGGEKTDYNFVSIVTATDLAAFEEVFSTVSSSPYIPSAFGSEISAVHDSIIKTELWKVENAFIDSTKNHPAKYMSMDYMDVAPDKNPDYLMLEEEVAKPIHEARIEKNIMSGWEVYSLIIPGGIEYGYNFATGNFYDRLEHIEYGFTNEVINQAIGTNANIPELFATIYETRDMVKVELWELIAHSE